MEKVSSVRPIIYTGPYFATNWLGDSLAADYLIWLSNWDVDQPDDCAGWTKWTFLQFTDSGTVPGIAGSVDINEFDGSVLELVGKKTNYPDVPVGHWAENAIAAVTAAKLMEGYEDGTFRPDQQLTRAELAMVLNHILYLINSK